MGFLPLVRGLLNSRYTTTHLYSLTPIFEFCRYITRPDCREHCRQPPISIFGLGCCFSSCDPGLGRGELKISFKISYLQEITFFVLAYSCSGRIRMSSNSIAAGAM